MQRVHLDIEVGEQAIDYTHVAEKEKLTELQLRVRQLLDQVDQISKEQNYQRVSFCVLLEKYNLLLHLKAYVAWNFPTYDEGHVRF